MVGTKSAINFLKHMIDYEFKYQIVNEGDTIDLGNKTLRFISAPFLHWPDSMYTYLVEDKILFTCDSFGAHFCDARMFDDLVDNFDDAFKHYFDVILKPFSNYMIKAINKIREVDIDVICPGHGPILRSNWKKYVDLSEKWANEALGRGKKPKVFIPYVSAYGNTGKVAEKVAEGVKMAGDIEVEAIDIEMMDLFELEEKVEDCTAILIGSPTVNQNILLPIYKLFAAINPITSRGKLGGAFGSYGWSGEGVDMIQSHLKNLKLKVEQEGLKVTFVPYEKTLEECVNFGKAFGERVLASKK